MNAVTKSAALFIPGLNIVMESGWRGYYADNQWTCHAQDSTRSAFAVYGED
ncbi:MAG: hypothetical protein HS127_07830 [Planctomycetia bacterium]|nr:hypothetical protein [Planctomycetia bacterium]